MARCKKYYNEGGSGQTTSASGIGGHPFEKGMASQVRRGPAAAAGTFWVRRRSTFPAALLLASCSFLQGTACTCLAQAAKPKSAPCFRREISELRPNVTGPSPGSRPARVGEAGSVADVVAAVFPRASKFIWRPLCYGAARHSQEKKEGKGGSARALVIHGERSLHQRGIGGGGSWWQADTYIRQRQMTATRAGERGRGGLRLSSVRTPPTHHRSPAPSCGRLSPTPRRLPAAPSLPPPSPLRTRVRSIHVPLRSPHAAHSSLFGSRLTADRTVDSRGQEEKQKNGVARSRGKRSG